MAVDKKALLDANKQIEYIQLKGKDYATVKERVKAFRMFFPDYSIITEIISMDDKRITMKATIKDSEGRTLATGHAQEEKGKGLVNTTSHVENCETSAIGRACAAFGIGIDADYASADEIITAIKEEQDELVKARDNPNTPITKKHIDAIRYHCAEDGVAIKDVCLHFGIEELGEMTLTQYFALTNNWPESVKRIKAIGRLKG